jgi:excisionase family DNA binding protein
LYSNSTNPADASPTAIDVTQRKHPQSVTLLPEPLLDSEEAAAIMKIHPKTLQKLARKGLIRGAHVGKLWRFRASEIESWIQRQFVG